MNRWFSKKDEGFTLVELMVVVLIIGILIAIAIPVFNLAVGNARTNACMGSMRTVESAIVIYDASNPDTPIVKADGVPAYTTAVGLLVPDFMAAEPACPEAAGVYSFAGGITSCSEHGAVQ